MVSKYQIKLLKRINKSGIMTFRDFNEPELFAVSDLKKQGLIRYTSKVQTDGMLVPDKIHITQTGIATIEDIKKDNFRFRAPFVISIVAIVLSVIAIIVSVIAIATEALPLCPR